MPKGTKNDKPYKAQTYYVSVEVIKKLRRMSYWGRMSQTYIVDTALNKAVKDYEKKNGELQPVPGEE